MKRIELRLECEHENYLNDVQDIPRAFSPYLIVNDHSEHFLRWYSEYKNDVFFLYIESDIFENSCRKTEIKKCNISEYKKNTKRFIKNELYRYLSEELQIKLPYGSLTGVRPTKLYYELSEKSKDAEKILVEKYFVSEKKAKIIAECVKNQKNYKNHDGKSIGLFLNIPFCPTKCKYCSFISTEIFRVKKQIGFYVESVKKELDNAFEIISKNGYDVRSIYVGGGTPTCLAPSDLDALLSPMKDFGVEFTVEGGRPDTINEEIVECLQRNNVTRVSVNPQTLCDDTLRLIGRSHTSEDFYRAFHLIREGGFSINTDLICGLPGETSDVFRNSLNGCIALRPENITIHTLSFKRGTVFTLDGLQKREFGEVGKMIDCGHLALAESGYVPYYMYRQKNMEDNLENTGYCLEGTPCLYNIDMMEESATIIGVGAGAMSKRISGQKIERFSSPKGFREYIERIDGTISAKKNFFLA